MEIELPDLYPGLFSALLNHTIVGALVSIPRLGWRNSDPSIYINLKATTIALIALILDIKVTNGMASFILAYWSLYIKIRKVFINVE